LRDDRASIYIDRYVVKRRTAPRRQRRLGFGGGRKSVLVVLLVPSVERDGRTAIDQNRWVDGALEMFGRVFGAQRRIRKRRVSGVMTNEAAHS
jgi:hypothetical protein